MTSRARKDREVVPFEIGDTVVLRKKHPCGSDTWKVHRIGADIGLTCNGCNRRIMLERPIVQRRMKSRTPVSEQCKSLLPSDAEG